jgi:predicted nucleic acid-binding protein
MKRYLLDTSSLMLLMKTANLKTQLNFLQTSYLLDLTFYEVGNALWKETCLTKFITKNEAQTLQKNIQIVLTKTDKICCETTDFQKISEIAETENLSFYDSSYLSISQEKKLILVTEDKKLSSKAKKHIEVKNIATLSAQQKLLDANDKENKL